MLSNATAVVSLCLGLTTLLGILGKWFIVKPLERMIDERTQPIQKHANGGLALPDVARTVDRIEKKLDRHIEWHMENK